MRAKTWVFECAEHSDFGTNGWKLKGQTNADPLQGMAVAHDILEHAPNGDMGVEDEMIALGASLYVREFTTNMHSLGANCSPDVREVLAHAWYEDFGLRDPGTTRAVPVEGEINDCIDGLVKEAQYDSGDFRERLTPEVLRGRYDCGASGSVDSAVEYWREKLKLSDALAPVRALAERYLHEFGAWDDLATADIDTLANRVLWTACCDIREQGEWLGLVH